VNIGLGDQLDALDLEFWAVIEKELSENLASYKKSGEEFLSARTLAQKNKAQANFYTEADKFISAILSSKNSSAILRAMVKYFYVTYFLKVTYFVPAKCGVLDLIPGKKLKDSDLMERTRSLKKELTSLSVPESAIVLIEDQPTIINNKSNTIQDQICYEFSNHEIYMVPPKWKNRLCFGKGLSYEEIKSKYAKKYTANKVHSKLNFLKLIDIVCENKMLEGIAKENYDDLADSCMQIIAYLQFK
jgi:hypothetical protein